MRYIMVLLLLLTALAAPLVMAQETGLGYVLTLKVTNGNTYNLTDIPVLLVFTSANFTDWDLYVNTIYFLDDDGEPLYFWVQEFNKTAHVMKIWVRIPLLEAGKPHTIYMYYYMYDTGVTPYTQYNNPRRTMLIYDDFEEGTLDTSYWSVTVYRTYTTSDGGTPTVKSDTLMANKKGSYYLWLGLNYFDYSTVSPVGSYNKVSKKISFTGNLTLSFNYHVVHKYADEKDIAEAKLVINGTTVWSRVINATTNETGTTVINFSSNGETTIEFIINVTSAYGGWWNPRYFMIDNVVVYPEYTGVTAEVVSREIYSGLAFAPGMGVGQIQAPPMVPSYTVLQVVFISMIFLGLAVALVLHGDRATAGLGLIVFALILPMLAGWFTGVNQAVVVTASVLSGFVGFLLLYTGKRRVA